MNEKYCRKCNLLYSENKTECDECHCKLVTPTEEDMEAYNEKDGGEEYEAITVNSKTELLYWEILTLGLKPWHIIVSVLCVAAGIYWAVTSNLNIFTVLSIELFAILPILFPVLFHPRPKRILQYGISTFTLKVARGIAAAAVVFFNLVVLVLHFFPNK